VQVPGASPALAGYKLDVAAIFAQQHGMRTAPPPN
jgi:hypothetical protein